MRMKTPRQGTSKALLANLGGSSGGGSNSGGALFASSLRRRFLVSRLAYHVGLEKDVVLL